MVFSVLNPIALHASIIEVTQGTAVINDATAAYYNPAALTLIKKPQIITLGSIAHFRTRFNGQSIQNPTNRILSGSSLSSTHYYLPALYVGIPITDRIVTGVALIANDFSRSIDNESVLRYAQSSNSVQEIELAPAVGFKINDYLSLGLGANIGYANFILKPISGFSSLTVPDSQSRNDSSGKGIGWDVGLLFKPASKTLVGFNHRSAVTYHLNGSSILLGNPELISNNYHFDFWTPARTTVSFNHFLTADLGIIGTAQWIQWNIFQTMHIHNIATRIGTQAVIVPNAVVPYHLHNSWIFTLGAHYHIIPQWVIRMAASYNQSPAGGKYQITNGDSIILAASTGYDINKNITIDGSYAHAFIKNQNIHINSARFTIDGVNSGVRDAVSLKLTFNLC